MLNAQHILTQAPNIRGALQHSTLAVVNERCSSTQAPNITGVLQCSTSAVQNERRSSTQAQIFALSI